MPIADLLLPAGSSAPAVPAAPPDAAPPGAKAVAAKSYYQFLLRCDPAKCAHLKGREAFGASITFTVPAYFLTNAMTFLKFMVGGIDVPSVADLAAATSSELRKAQFSRLTTVFVRLGFAQNLAFWGQCVIIMVFLYQPRDAYEFAEAWKSIEPLMASDRKRRAFRNGVEALSALLRGHHRSLVKYLKAPNFPSQWLSDDLARAQVSDHLAVQEVLAEAVELGEPVLKEQLAGLWDRVKQLPEGADQDEPAPSAKKKRGRKKGDGQGKRKKPPAGGAPPPPKKKKPPVAAPKEVPVPPALIPKWAVVLKLLRHHGLTLPDDAQPSEDAPGGWRAVLVEKIGRLTLADCAPARKEIRFSLIFLQDASDAELKETALHEIAHAFTPGAGHGRDWRRQCERVGCDPKARCSGLHLRQFLMAHPDIDPAEHGLEGKADVEDVEVGAASSDDEKDDSDDDEQAARGDDVVSTLEQLTERLARKDVLVFVVARALMDDLQQGRSELEAQLKAEKDRSRKLAGQNFRLQADCRKLCEERGQERAMEERAPATSDTEANDRAVPRHKGPPASRPSTPVFDMDTDESLSNEGGSSESDSEVGNAAAA